ncbi:MAG: hypothetical protein JW818_08565 [Pirellulales bacterium]|nr:hypothetical protein [Pirellulales bacterium]
MTMEYLIKRTDGDWFDLHYDQFPEALHPKSLPSDRIEGWGDYRIRVHGTEVSFSYEDPGIHVVFEGKGISREVADRIVDEIAAKVTAVTGQSASVLPL